MSVMEKWEAIVAVTSLFVLVYAAFEVVFPSKKS